MDSIATSTLFLALAFLLCFSAFFSMSETAMMASNRVRLQTRAAQGERGAALALALLARTDRLLGVILLGNNLVNSAAAALSTALTFRLVGQNEAALGVATVGVTFAILVFSEATPKVIAAAHADKVSVWVSYPLTLFLKLFFPIVALVNVFVRGLLKLLRITPHAQDAQLTPEELRVLVLESSQAAPQKHQSVLLNVFDLQNQTVDDVMVPRGHIEMIDLADSIRDIEARLRNCHHTRLLVCEGSKDNIIGILHTKKVLHLSGESLSVDALRSVLRPPYFIPEGTPLFSQLQSFQEHHRRIAIVVDEYGELLGLVSLEDILEQLIGRFTTQAPAREQAFELQENDEGERFVELDGAVTLRELNRSLKTNFPLDHAKTLNGLILEHFQDIPEVGVCFKRFGCVFEVLQTQKRLVKRVRLTLLEANDA